MAINLDVTQQTTLAENFLKTCGGQKNVQITREMLAEFSGSNSKLFVNRLFEFINPENKNGVTYSEFIKFINHYRGESDDAKTNFLFQLYDLNGDGGLDRNELFEMLQISMLENKLQLDDNILNDLVTTLMEEALSPQMLEKNPAATLKINDFRKLFHGHQELLQNLSTIIEKWLQPAPKEKKRRTFVSSGCRNVFHWLKNNSVFITWLSIFYMVNILLFSVRVLLFYKETTYPSPYLALARGCGWCLDFNSCFILLTMMRVTLTKLRATFLTHILPIDDHKIFHRRVGELILLLALCHMGFHLLHVFYFLKLTDVTQEILEKQEDQNSTEKIRDFSGFQYMIDPNKTKQLGLLPGFAYISGFVLILALCLMILLTASYIRRNGYFHVFYISHMICYPLYYFLLVLHCNNFWKWFIVPGVLFIVEQIVRTYYIKIAFKTTVSSGFVLQSKVTNLVLVRPRGFNFNPGDYIFINIPKFSNFEWHAFTISSAPENWDELGLHIRAVGPWTETLYNFFHYVKKRSEIKVLFKHDKNEPFEYKNMSRIVRKMSKAGERKLSSSRHFRQKRTCSLLMDIPDSSNHSEFRAKHGQKSMTLGSVNAYRHFARRPLSIFGKPEVLINTQNSMANNCSESGQTPDQMTQIFGKPLQAFIDGPYGAPSSEIFWAEHAVLIGGGIGVTPFASILQSIMYRHWNTKITCPSCQYKFNHGFHNEVNKVKKVDFFWLNGEQNAFSWFLNLLSNLEIEQEEIGGQLEPFLDIHMYMTKALKRNDMKAVALQLALDIFYEKNKRDCLAKLKTRMNSGRPDWDKVFKNLKECNKGNVHVFFCGPPELGARLNELCAKYEFTFRTETF